MKSGRRKVQMKKEKVKTKANCYSPENCSDHVVSEIKSQLQMLHRNQLEKLICMLGQEVVRLEHKLQSCSLRIVNADGQSEHSDCQTIINGDSESRPLRTKCSVVHRLVQFVKSVSHFKAKKAGEIIKQQQHVKDEQLSNTEGSKTDLNLNNEVVGDESENSCEHTDIQLPSYQKNVECSTFSRIHQPPMKRHIVSDGAVLEDMFFSKGTEFNRKKEMTINTQILPNEKIAYSCFMLLNSTCEESKTPLRNQKHKPVSLEHQHEVPSTGNNKDSFKLSNSGKHVNNEEGSVQDRAGVTHYGCVNRSVPHEKVQLLEKSNKYKVTKWPSAHSVLKIASQASSVKDVLKIPSETSQENGMFICYFCKVPFQSKLILTEHMKTEHNCTQYCCIVCGKSFKYKHSLKAHQKGSHTGTTVLCSYCGKLVLQARLDIHMEKVHERPNYTCHICQKGFLKRECLEGHINKHSNTKPYICEHCGRKYAYSTSLSSHRKQCARASMPPHLQNHRSLDNKSVSCVCEICGLKFEGVSGLKDHLSAKHSDKVQYCSFCGKGFQWRPSYNRHIKKCVDRTDLERDRYRWLKSQKTVNKYYVCVCGKQYPYRQSFRRHERSCHQKQAESSISNSGNTAASSEALFSENLSSSLQLSTSLNM